jgi:endonuclease/exonuclease/phosphatase family metal-dependent hydrolase
MSFILFQRNVKLRIGHYGNAILSRFPLVEHVDVDLTLPLKKRRRALTARCRSPHGAHHKSVVLANVHLGLAGFERQAQLRKLLDHRSIARLRRRTPLVVAGDYNDVWSTLGRRVMYPREFELAGPGGPTFPAAMPIRRLDRVFYRGDLRATHAFAGHTDLARRASDHLPLIVDFEFTRK